MHRADFRRSPIRASRMVAMGVVVAGGLFAACERHDTGAYDPRVDGVSGISTATPDMTVLEDQTKLPRTRSSSSDTARPTPAAARDAAPASAPATMPAAGAASKTPAPETAPAGVPGSSPTNPITPATRGR